VPAYWPGGVRHGGDVSLICCFRVEREKACPETSAPRGGERERPKRLKPQGIEYRRGGALADWLVVVMKPL
jgi:hypothetical protein